MQNTPWKISKHRPQQNQSRAAIFRVRTLTRSHTHRERERKREKHIQPGARHVLQESSKTDPRPNAQTQTALQCNGVRSMLLIAPS